MKKDENTLTNFNLQSEYKRKVVTQNSLLAFSIIMVVLILGLVGSYTGYVFYHEGKAGYIHEMNLEFKRPSWNWAGLYGAAFGVGLTQPWEFDIEEGDMIEANIFFDCFEVGVEHEVYASTVPFEDVDLNSLEPATPAEINAFMGIDSSATDSADKTFLGTMSIQIGSLIINNIPSTLTEVGDGTNVTRYDIGMLKDGDGDIVMVSHVYDSLTKGFNDRYYNYQMLLPTIANTTTRYYVWSDPNDICLGGSENPQILGLVVGNVTDVSGNPVEDVIVVVGAKSTVTDSSGYYNVTAQVGENFIIAIKEGYKVYQNLVNVTENNVTEHNIVLELEPSDNQYTDIGPSFDAGVDAQGTENDIGPGDVPFQIEYPQVIEGSDYIIPITRIFRKLRLGEFSQEALTIFSYKANSAQINLKLTGNVSKLTQLDAEKLIIPANGDAQFLFTFFANESPGLYNGSINLSGDINAIIPVAVEILDKEKIPIQALLISLSAQDKTLYSGSTFRFRTDLTNLLSDQQYPVQLLYTIQNVEGTETIWTHKTNLFLETSLSTINNVELPTDMPIGDYILRVTAQYLDLSSSSSYIFEVELPFYQYILFGKVRLWHALLALAGLIGIIFAIIVVRRKIEANKKYHLQVELNEMPKEGPRSIKVGKIAETQYKAYFNLENFKTHAIVAGSTGGGKSFSAQVIIEEMLLKDIAVIVFDPTAQWTGMLRKLTNKGLLALYPNYGLKPNDAKAFKGNIRQINDPLEIIDVRDYMKPGEIQVFACHKLDPKDIDVFVANSVRQVFRAAFDESEPLRLELVYDEVHRLLPKFGGSGEGFLQIERACREFRKWGIGVMLISQVLADFMGQIKANINTEVQMRTRDEGDLDRIATKYGKDVLQSLVKASVGTGMCQNAAYNRGRPFFVTFRPIMHSVARLSDAEIVQYNEANEKVDQMGYELEQLEKAEQDVFDLKLELKLALDKVKAGNFNMANIYLEGIQPRINKLFEKLGMKPKKLVREKADAAEMKAELEKMKAEHAKDHPEDAEKEAKKKNMKPEELFKEDVPPDKIFHLKNDMLVVNPKSLITEIQAMKDDAFESEIKDNTFATWFRDAVGDEELAKLIEQETEKKAITALLELREKGTKLPKFEQKRTAAQIAGKEEGEEEDKEPSKEEEKKAFDEMSKNPDEEEEEEAHKEEEKQEESKTKENKEPEQKTETNSNEEKTQESKSSEAEQPSETSSEKPTEEEAPVEKTEAAPAKETKEEQKASEGSKEESKIETKTSEENKVENKENTTSNSKEDSGESSQKTKENSEKPQKDSFDELSQPPNNSDSNEPSETSAQQTENQENKIEENKQETEQQKTPNPIMTKEANPDQTFKLENGDELKSLNDLKEELNKMSDEIFNAHVNNERNDFANWTRGVFEANEIADKIQDTKTIAELKEVLQNV